MASRAMANPAGDRAPLGWVLFGYARESVDQVWERCAPHRTDALIAAVRLGKPTGIGRTPHPSS
ncbi:hypothetical protein JL101_007985 [Skermanella rosea]|uniref:hypothetical protein n=1 Tax=Skermanella rosea TaxID=1817965 RepID=UPI0019329290|nr:hypothetical protein [Skermanella rosea]UEM05363.1 hypothetical protein JL101_007985 [Skermanella rosea]